METFIILSVWFIGSLLSYFVVKYFMIKFKKSLDFSFRTKPLYNNSDMLVNIFISFLGSWLTIIITCLVHLNLINKNFDKWSKEKSKY
jgi:hypothetical protein